MQLPSIPSQLNAILAYVTNVAGWAALLTLAWKAGKRTGTIEERLDSLATNHLPHIQAELESLRADLRAVVQTILGNQHR